MSEEEGSNATVEVSICIICYNQEKYIVQAIESALGQRCTFPVDILICDDCSTDGTMAIIKSFAERYPGKIKVYPAPANLGMLRNWERALKLCKGKYIALLEGDDFWNDENKLQKQYQILEANPNYSTCFTNASIKYETGPAGFPDYVTLTGNTYTTHDLLEYNFVPTCSVLMRNNISESFFPPAYFKSPFADWVIHILNSQFGQLYFLNEFACTYRVHNAGVWGGINEEKQLKNKLLAIDCINEIIEDRTLKVAVKRNRKGILQKLCAYYKQKNEASGYLNYRFKLLFN
jgi:glycosyltransferase involved in cell wall biosynthesis